MGNIIILDTETTRREQSVFDIGLIVATEDGTPITSRQWLIFDTFTRPLFYEDKRNLYGDRLDDEDTPTKMKRARTALNEIANLIEKYQVKEVYAYNAGFDTRVLERLAEEFNSIYPLQKVEIECLWSWSAQTILQEPNFKIFAEQHGFVSAKGNIQTSAEVTYAYLTNDPAFVEEHTALEDCKIELEIYKACRKISQKRIRGIVGNPWVLPQSDEQMAKMPKGLQSLRDRLKQEMNALIDKAVDELE